MPSVGIIGASGFIGAELLRLVTGHPDLDLVFATGDSHAGTPIAGLYPSLAGVVGSKPFDPWDPILAEGVDAVFCALPHGISSELMPELLKRAPHVFDMAADFRLRDAGLYPTWYGEEHPHPELLADFAYGLPELFRPDLVGAAAVAVPGCYPTSAALALAPLRRCRRWAARPRCSSRRTWRR
jgi:N-acetyl-gamma-glutamyl-phosphate reductase